MVDAIDEDLPLGRVDHPYQQVDYQCLARARASRQADGFATADGEAGAVERAAPVELDGDVAELDVAIYRAQRVVGVSVVGYVRYCVEDLGQATPRGDAALHHVAYPAEGDERPLDTFEQEHEARELPDGELAAYSQHQPPAHQQQQRDREAEHELHQREQRPVDPGQRQVAAHELVVETPEPLDLALLDAEAFVYPDAAE